MPSLGRLSPVGTRFDLRLACAVEVARRQPSLLGRNSSVAVMGMVRGSVWHQVVKMEKVAITSQWNPCAILCHEMWVSFRDYRHATTL